jgi:hypothetical protein
MVGVFTLNKIKRPLHEGKENGLRHPELTPFLIGKKRTSINLLCLYHAQGEASCGNLHVQCAFPAHKLQMSAGHGCRRRIRISEGSNWAHNDAIIVRRKAAVAPGRKRKRSITALPAVDPILVIASHNQMLEVSGAPKSKCILMPA